MSLFVRCTSVYVSRAYDDLLVSACLPAIFHSGKVYLDDSCSSGRVDRVDTEGIASFRGSG